MLYHTEAIVLKRNIYREKDLLVTFYAKERGKITVRALGALKKEAKLRAHLEPLFYTHISVAPSKKNGWDIITGNVGMNCFCEVYNDSALSAAAFYVSEITDKLIPAPEKDLAVWDFLLKALHFFNNSPDKEKFAAGVSYFQWKLLDLLGYRPDIGFKEWDWEKGNEMIQMIAGEKINSYDFLKRFL